MWEFCPEGEEGLTSYVRNPGYSTALIRDRSLVLLNVTTTCVYPQRMSVLQSAGAEYNYVANTFMERAA